MTYGVIDVGSNTVRLSIYDIKENNIVSLFNNKNTAGLIGYVEDGKLSREGIRKACDVLGEFKDIASYAHVEALYVFATASLRNISNTTEVTDAIKKMTGLDVEVLSGEEEAVLDFRGAAHAVKLQKGVMVDIGGGSTEIVTFERGKIKNFVSLDFGSLSMYKNYVSNLFPDEQEIKAIRKKTKTALEETSFLQKGKYPQMTGIGGTIRAVKKMNNAEYDLGKSNNIIDADNIHKILDSLKGDEKKLLNKVLKTTPDRVHTFIPGLIILDTICRYCDTRVVTMSNFGVREGYLYKKAVIER